VKALAPDCTDKVRFAGLSAGDAVEVNGSVSGYKSDLYVFAFQNERDPCSWDALNLSQWEFYLLEKIQLTGTKSISLPNLKRLCPTMSAAELQVVGRAKIRDLAAAKATLIPNS